MQKKNKYMTAKEIKKLLSEEELFKMKIIHSGTSTEPFDEWLERINNMSEEENEKLKKQIEEE